MSTYTKSIQADLLSLQSVAASTVLISSDFDMSTKLGGMVLVRFGRRAATAAGAGVNIRVEASHASSGDNSWYPLAILTTNFAAAQDEPVSGTVSAGTNVITVAATTGFTAGDIVFIDNGTIANSEWGRVKSIVAATSITIEDNLVNAQTSSNIYDSAEIFAPVVIPKEVTRIRVVADGSSFTQAFAVEASLITTDSIA